MADKQLNRVMKDLKVHCLHAEAGCKWTGKLKLLDSHLNSKSEDLEDCEHAHSKCKACNRVFPRSALLSHSEEECLEAKVPCQFQAVGCQAVVKRKDMKSHVESNLPHHMVLHNQKLAEELDTLKTKELEKPREDASYVSREMLKNEIAKLQVHTTKQVRSTIWSIGGCFLAITIAILLASNLIENPVRLNTQQPAANPINAINEEMKTWQKDFLQHNRKHEEKLAELESIIKECIAGIEELKNKPHEDMLGNQETEKIRKSMANLEQKLMEYNRARINTEQDILQDIHNLNSTLADLMALRDELANMMAATSKLSLKSELQDLRAELKMEMKALLVQGRERESSTS